MINRALGVVTVPHQQVQSTAQLIPFRPENHGMGGNVAEALFVSALLLGSCVLLLWHARKRGLLNQWLAPPAGTRTVYSGFCVEGSLRLSRSTTLYRVCDRDAHYLILESSGAAQIVRSDGRTIDA